MSFSPYLFFSGNCADAFSRYREIFGGQLHMTRNSDVPEDSRMPGGPDSVMHAALPLGDNALLMGSDDPTGTGGPKVGFSVCFTAPGEKEAVRVYEALADGGKVTMPFAPTFWSQGFGMCNDRFGVPWMIDVAGEPPS